MILPRVVVEQRGRARVLRVDGTFASLWRPGDVRTGSVWDALVTPLLALPPARRRDVLILGLGAGSAARLVRAIAPNARITGIEFDDDVLRAARAHFELDALRVHVVCGDALAWLRRSRARFDAILDDVFVGSGRAVHKPDWLPEPGLALALQRLRPGGMLVTNTIDEAPRIRHWLLEHSESLIDIAVDGYDNHILAVGRPLCSARRIRQAMIENPVLGATARRFRFRTWKREC